jgi:predicted DNA-binding WGR domain protein
MNVVVHCDEGNHDKVYIGCIRKQGGSYQVIGKWGRVGKTLSSQMKGSSASLAGAAVIRDNVIQEKIAKGYRNIEDPSYHGRVTFKTPCVAENLEPEISEVSPSPKKSEEPGWPSAEAGKKASVPNGQFAVVCRDNTGIEERFDENVEYIAEVHSDLKMIYVFDKFGKKDEFLRERFVTSTDGFQKPKAGDFMKLEAGTHKIRPIRAERK